MENPHNHVKLCYKIANQIHRKYQDRLLTRDDYISHGYLGLIEACKRFDPERINSKEPIKNGKPNYIKFSTYASFWIKSYINTAINKSNYFKTESLIDNTYIIENSNKIEIKDLLLRLNKVEHLVILSYFFENKSSSEIARELHFHAETVRCIKRRALRKMSNPKIYLNAKH